jgi:hypothetical protein
MWSMMLALSILLALLSIRSSIAELCSDMSVNSLDFIKENNKLNITDRWLSQGSTGCPIRNATVAQGRSCMTGRKFAFFGDSMTRDMGSAMVEFAALGKDFFDLGEKNYERAAIASMAPPFTNRCICSHRNEIITGASASHECFKKDPHRCAHAQVYTNDELKWEIWVFLEGSFGHRTFKTVAKIQELVKFDLIFLGNHGFHGIEYYVPKEYPGLFLKPLLGWKNPLVLRGRGARSLRTARTSAVPVAAVAAQPSIPYIYLTINQNYDDKKIPIFGNLHQESLADYLNLVTLDFMRLHKLAFYDMSMLSRFKELSADGVHLSQWANLLNIKLILHFACDAEWRFRSAGFFQPSP